MDDTLYSQFDLTCRAIQHVLALFHDFPFHQAYDRIAHYSEVLSEGNLFQVSANDERAMDMRIRRFILSLQEFGVSVSFQPAEAIQSEYIRLQRSMKPFDGALDLIAKLTAMGYVIGIITNGNVTIN